MNEIDDWLLSVNRYLSATNTNENKWVLHAVSLLESEALSWWNSVERTDGRQTATYSWEEFEKVMLDRYVPEGSETVAINKMSTWKQTGSVTAYIRQFRAFDQLVRKESLPEHVRVSMFIRGLKSELRRLVKGWQLKTLPEVYQKALSYDVDYNSGQSKFSYFSPSRFSGNRAIEQQDGTKHNPITINNAETETEEDESDLNQVSGQYSQRGVCHYCKSPDHYRDQCLKLKKKREEEAKYWRASKSKNR